MASLKEGMTNGDGKKPLFRALDSQIDMDEMETSVIESLCMKCHENVRKALVVWRCTSIHVVAAHNK